MTEPFRLTVDAVSHQPGHLRTALSQYYNLLFFAHTDKIHVYQPNCPYQTLVSPRAILELPRSQSGLRGYVDPDNPHAVNHLVVADFGNEEIVVVACDDGDVIAYLTRPIFDRIQKEAPDLDDPIIDYCFAPLLLRNVGRSAWGIAVHKEARLIAVSANTASVVVFAFALSQEFPSPGFDRWGSFDIGCDADADADADALVARRQRGGWFRPSRGKRVNPGYRALFNFELHLRYHNNNIPAISFYNPSGPCDSSIYLVSTDIEGHIIVWDVFEQKAIAELGDPSGQGWNHARGWGVVCIDPNLINVAGSAFEMHGCAPDTYWSTIHGDEIIHRIIDVSKGIDHVPDSHRSHPHIRSSHPQSDDAPVASINTHQQETEHESEDELEIQHQESLFASEEGSNSTDAAEGLEDADEEVFQVFDDEDELDEEFALSLQQTQAATTVQDNNFALSLEQSQSATVDEDDETVTQNPTITNPPPIQSAFNTAALSLDQLQQAFISTTSAFFANQPPSMSIGYAIPPQMQHSPPFPLMLQSPLSAPLMQHTPPPSKRRRREKSVRDPELPAEPQTGPEPRFSLPFHVLHTTQHIISLFHHIDHAADVGIPCSYYMNICREPLVQDTARQLAGLRQSQRLNMVLQVPELGLVAIANQIGRVAIIVMTRSPFSPPSSTESPPNKRKAKGETDSKKQDVGFRLERFLPTKGQGYDDDGLPLGVLAGIAIAPMQGHEDKPKRGDETPDVSLSRREKRGEGSGRKWRLMMMYRNHTVLSYEISRRKGWWDDGLLTH
ncbi:MAG: hypothetical protein Q9190_006656 [Brigantiaea leucoxantha]